MTEILQKLNDKQLEAVTCTHGPLLVVAGAGSGKTRALTHRIAYMIQEKGINPWNILAVTFTNKAANEMKQRIIKLLGKNEQDADLPSVGTFHATCVRILRKNIHLLDYENSFTIYDTADQQILMKHVLEDLRIDEKQFNPRAILHHISNAKNELVSSEKYKYAAHNAFTEKVAEVYKYYQEALKKANALDFDDIIMKTVELFQQEPTILDSYQEKFKFISIDEYQDTNHAQYILTNLLAQKYRNICVIGDSDQSIYSFRGANITNILNFEKDYPEAKVVLLEENYRSSQPILDAAHSIIIKNAKRKEKKLWTTREGGEKITLKQTDTDRGESEYVAREIQKHLQRSEHRDYTNFVVLYRTNAQSRVMEEAMLRYGMPYKIVGGIKFYARKEVKDLIAYLRVIQNPADTVSLLRIINTPPRKIGPKTMEGIQNYAFTHKLTFFQAMQDVEKIPEISGPKAESIKAFVGMMKDLQKVNGEFPASGLIKHVIDSTGYKRFLDDGTSEGEARVENTYELINVASKYDNLEPALSLNIFLEEIALISDLDGLDTQDNAVTLMTIHSAKGLEFPVVFIVGLEEGVLPHSRSLLDRDELEEERRLMYVAITRAKDKLYFTHSRSRMVYGEMQNNTPSQFIEDIPDEVLESDPTRMQRKLKVSDISYTPIPYEEYPEEAGVELHDGDRVYHQTFGEGTVVNVTGGVATVAFKNVRYGVKKLALSVAPLKKIED
ncbi:DNA helicase PcrA [Candidatus Peregrinibacteria bacterium]|nr:DNA helicase PcrA [Candidatus Peregrinibacteria bacterium]